MAWGSIAVMCEERDTSRRLADFSGDHRLPGSAPVSRAGFGVSPKRSLKVRETGTVSPARETRALPGGRIEQGICR
jgi:hypothetical protein